MLLQPTASPFAGAERGNCRAQSAPCRPRIEGELNDPIRTEPFERKDRASYIDYRVDLAYLCKWNLLERDSDEWRPRLPRADGTALSRETGPSLTTPTVRSPD